MKLNAKKILAVILITSFVLSSFTYGITYEELKQKYGYNYDFSSLTAEEMKELESTENYIKFKEELDRYISYKEFSNMINLKKGIIERDLEVSKYLGINQKMKAQYSEDQLKYFTRGRALNYMLMFNNNYNEAYAPLIEDNNLLSEYQFEIITHEGWYYSNFIPYWKPCVDNLDEWTDKDFVEFIVNDRMSKVFIWSENLKIKEDKVLIKDKNSDDFISLSENFTDVEGIDGRIFKLIKTLTRYAVQSGGTVSVYADSSEKLIYVGINDKSISYRETDNELFGFIFNYSDTDTMVTIDLMGPAKKKEKNKDYKMKEELLDKLYECLEIIYDKNFTFELKFFVKNVINVGYDKDLKEENEGIISYYKLSDGKRYVHTTLK